jgi:hypothetical protein
MAIYHIRSLFAYGPRSTIPSESELKPLIRNDESRVGVGGGAAAIGAVCGAALQTGRRAGGASMAGIRQWFMADFKADI